MKYVTNEILRAVFDGMSNYEVSDIAGISPSNVFKYRRDMNPGAETWLKTLVRLGHVRVKDGQLIIKSDVINKDLLKELAS